MAISFLTNVQKIYIFVEMGHATGKMLSRYFGVSNINVLFYCRMKYRISLLTHETFIRKFECTIT